MKYTSEETEKEGEHKTIEERQAGPGAGSR